MMPPRYDFLYHPKRFWDASVVLGTRGFIAGRGGGKRALLIKTSRDTEVPVLFVNRQGFFQSARYSARFWPNINLRTPKIAKASRNPL